MNRIEYHCNVNISSSEYMTSNTIWPCARLAVAAQVGEGEREGVYEALMGVSIPKGPSFPSAMIYISKMCDVIESARGGTICPFDLPVRHASRLAVTSYSIFFDSRM